MVVGDLHTAASDIPLQSSRADFCILTNSPIADFWEEHLESKSKWLVSKSKREIMTSRCCTPHVAMQVMIVGDLNIAASPDDVHPALDWTRVILSSFPASLLQQAASIGAISLTKHQTMYKNTAIRHPVSDSLHIYF